MIDYIWNFETFDVSKNDGEMSDVVVAINWSLTAVNSDEAGSRSVSIAGTTGLENPDPENFIPLSLLTQEWAIAEVLKYNNETELKEGLYASLFNNQPTIQSVVPLFNKEEEGI